MCFRGPKTCRDGGNADLRVNRGHEHVDLHVFQGSQDVPRAGWLAGCGDVDLRVNREHEHFDLHVFQGPKTCRGLAGWLSAGTPIYVSTEGTITSIYTCFRGPKTCAEKAGTPIYA